mmetsp:Transcript_11790/g.24326  ORF Transcript_11790/g.24326 Transcript_11790/m.24326 type:complete len:222 (-) Transcript_11790:23-688(-)
MKEKGPMGFTSARRTKLPRSLCVFLFGVAVGVAEADIAPKLSLTPSLLSLHKTGLSLHGRTQLETLSLGTRPHRASLACPPGNAPLRLRGGAKSKNHTNHNQSRKAHRNGIKRVKKHRHTSMKERDVKVWRNERYARKGSMRVYKQRLDAKKAVERGKRPYLKKHSGKGKAERLRKATVRNGGEMQEDEEREKYRSPSSVGEDDDDDEEDGDDDDEEEEDE